MPEQVKHERLNPVRVEQLEHRLGQALMGYDTGALARIYAQDVKYLLKEIELLTAELEAVNKARMQYDVPRQLIEDMRAEPQKPPFDWPWVAQVGTPAECMTKCLTLIAHTMRMLCVDGELNAEQQAVRDQANGLLTLFGDPLAPKQPLGVMEVPSEVK